MNATHTIAPKYEKTLMRKIFEACLYAGMIAVSTVAILVLVSVVWGSFWNDIPVEVTDLNPNLGNVCPNDIRNLHLRVQVKHKLLLYQYVSVMNPALTENISGTQVSIAPMPQPVPSTFVETIPWEVPNIPSGDYSLVYAARSNMGGQDPVFHTNSFTIGDSCEHDQ